MDMMEHKTEGKEEKEEAKRGKGAQPIHDQLEQVAEPEAGQGKQALAQMSVAEQESFVRSPRLFSAQRAEAMLELQQAYGNKYVQRLAEEAKEAILDEDTGRRIERQRRSGKPLEPEVRSQMEAAFGSDFSRVRVHADAEADRLSRQLGANAFTTGKDIFFRGAAYQPDSENGARLIAHELTHVVQQRGNAICSGGITDEPIANRKSEDVFEQEAGRVAEQVVGGRVDSRQDLEIRNSEEAGQTDVEAETRQSEKVETRTVSFNVTLVPQKGAKSISHLSGSPKGGFIQCQRTAYFVIGDRGLDTGGGVFLRTLEALRDRLVTLRIQGDWSLIVSIHGSENFVANAGRAVRGGAGSYDAAAITRIFGDAEFRQWRDQQGPVRIVLNACQVAFSLERTIISAITRPVPPGQPGQPAYGLGTGCRPETIAHTVEIGGRAITTRAQYGRLSPPDRQTFQGMLSPLNTRWGYFGIPPVPADQILDYYFDEAPRGSWVVVQVSVNRVVQDIPFWNRGTNPEFRRVCTQGVVQLPARRPTVPPVRVTP
jgi:hypothetical protein